jgi:pimeloyl-ACP methyl ester carboxylesterase
MMRWVKRLGLVLVLLLVGGIAFAWTPDGDRAALIARYSDGKSRFVDLGEGLRVHVRVDGPADAPVMLLIHGSNASLHTWAGWTERLAGRYRLVAIDLPGHGLTGAHPRRDYREEMFIEVIDRVVDRLGLPPAIVAGNSMGGELAWKYARAHPQQVRGLVLIDASGAPGAFPDHASIGHSMMRSAALRPVLRHLTPRILIEQSLKDSLAVQQVVTPAMVDRYWELLRFPGNRDATLDRATVRRPAATPAAMAALGKPVLILWGAADRLIPPRYGQWYQRAIPGAQLIVYPGIGHVPMEEAPARTAADVDAWARRLPAMAAGA